MGEGHNARLRSLPAVHELAGTLRAGGAAPELALAAARAVIDARRVALMAGEQPAEELTALARSELRRLEQPSLRRVLNATGVLLHTNLGRAPLARAAQMAVARVAEGYANLELDLDTGRRGSRQAHVEGLLCELTGAQAALVVGNGAGAVLLAVAALAGGDKGVIVSRGQLVEIGGGFRIPDVIKQSGARLIEVGTTNRTNAADYRQALAAPPGGVAIGAILRVHQSNFRTVGFVEAAPLRELCGLGVPVIDDVGSGVIDPGGLAALGDEPSLRGSVSAGAALVCCSADKLLGGPQAGLLVGRTEAVAATARHPLARALRIDKLSLGALEATLELHRDPAQAVAEVPALRMLAADEPELLERATAMSQQIGPQAEIVSAIAKVGGGALPLLELPGPAVAVTVSKPEAVAAALRRGEPAVVARIDGGRLLLDPRTLTDEEAMAAADAVRALLTDR